MSDRARFGYRSTRGGVSGLSFEEAVMAGLAPDGALLVPEVVPAPPEGFLRDWRDLSYQDLALEIFSLFVPEREVCRADLRELIAASYAAFTHDPPTPLRADVLGEGTHVLELFHGPTLAFKDVALQFLGNLFEYFLERRNARLRSAGRGPEVMTVVGATSGDTGSAAIYGLRGKRNVSIFILHPRGRVSPVQEAQMTTLFDKNVHNLAIEGTFDDCQDIVKAMFADEAFRSKLRLGAVNSINWARILAQVVYYFHAYFSLVRHLPASRRGPDFRVRFVVPTGNFGDVLAGYYAKRMGLPIWRLTVATNENDILARFFATGRYGKAKVQERGAEGPADSSDRSGKRGRQHLAGAAKATMSPAMDILFSSNFERLLWHLAKDDAEASGAASPEDAERTAGNNVSRWMGMLKDGGVEIAPAVVERAREVFDSVSTDDTQTLRTIAKTYERSGYLLDPHTAVGVHAAETLNGQPGVPAKLETVCLATAHPAKFPSAISKAFGSPESASLPEEIRAKLAPPALEGLMCRPRRSRFVPGDGRGRPASPRVVMEVIEEELRREREE